MRLEIAGILAGLALSALSGCASSGTVSEPEPKMVPASRYVKQTPPRTPPEDQEVRVDDQE